MSGYEKQRGVKSFHKNLNTKKKSEKIEALGYAYTHQGCKVCVLWMMKVIRSVLKQCHL